MFRRRKEIKMKDIYRKIFEVGKQIGKEEALNEESMRWRDTQLDNTSGLWRLLIEAETLLSCKDARMIAEKRLNVCTGEKEENWDPLKRQRNEWKNRSEVLWGLLEEIENLPVNYPYLANTDEARRIAKKRHDICTIYKKRDKP